MKAFHEVRKYENDFRVWVGSYKNIGFLPHWHKEIELIYVKSGTAKMRINGKNYIAKKGDLIICDSGVTHASPSFNMDNSLEFLIFDTSVFTSSYNTADFITPLITAEMLEAYKMSDELKRIFKILKKELQKKDIYYKETVKASVSYLWHLIMRNVPKNGNIKNEKNKRTQLIFDMDRLLEFLNSSFTEAINLEAAAKRMGQSECYFSRMFKKLTGSSFVSYINNLRVEYAAELLKNSSSTVTDIALNCGFNNVRTFNRVFKEITGYTPVQFSKLSTPELMGTSYFHTSSEQFFVENDSSVIIRNL